MGGAAGALSATAIYPGTTASTACCISARSAATEDFCGLDLQTSSMIAASALPELILTSRGTSTRSTRTSVLSNR